MYFEAFGTSQNPNEIPNPRFSSRLHRVWDHFFWFYLPTKRKVADYQVKPFQERQLQRARTAPGTRELFILQNPRQAGSGSPGAPANRPRPLPRSARSLRAAAARPAPVRAAERGSSSGPALSSSPTSSASSPSLRLRPEAEVEARLG